jgi:hypothetical protein
MPDDKNIAFGASYNAIMSLWISFAEKAPIPTGPPEWEIRESLKFLHGEYKLLPWKNEEWWARSDSFKKHYAHVSKDDPSKLAYTPSERHGIEDRQVRVKPGRYLNKYFGDVLSSQDVQFWAGKFAGENEQLELKFAHTPDEIERIYKEGPHSCMKSDEFSSSQHPARVYGAGDLAVAYIEDKEHITARCVVWPEKLARSVIYGDEARLGTLLANAGYSPDSRFDGAKLLAIEANKGFVAPYIDGGYYLERDGDYLVLGRTGMPCNTTTGIIGAFFCQRCEEYDDEDSSSYIHGADQNWCESCYESHAFYCEHCDETHEIGNDVWIAGENETWCEECASDDAFTCESCDSRHSMSDINNVDNECWCQACVEYHTTTCDRCEKVQSDSKYSPSRQGLVVCRLC